MWRVTRISRPVVSTLVGLVALAVGLTCTTPAFAQTPPHLVASETRWEIPGAELENFERAWREVQRSAKTDASLSDFLISYDTRDDGDVYITFYREGSIITDTRTNTVTVKSNSEIYGVILNREGARIVYTGNAMSQNR